MYARCVSNATSHVIGGAVEHAEGVNLFIMAGRLVDIAMPRHEKRMMR